MSERVCENCAMPDEELVLVRRVYVTPERWDSPRAEARVVDEAELWCISCCSQYPHVVEGDDEDTTDT
ncbi:MAG TPA: hypothetical protein VGN59_18565 [Acidimicrobiia bacterium]